MARLMRELDWSRTALGPVERWSESLRTTVDLMLAAHSEIVLFCGPEFVALYNDAYVPTIGDKHPQALGLPARVYWSELWDDLEPLLRGVFETGKTFSAKDRPFYIERSEAGETVYFDVSYSAVRAADGTVEAVLCLVTETTERVLATRALRESEARFRALVAASSDVIYRMSPDWTEMRQLDGRGFVSDIDGPMIRWQEEFLFAEDRALVQDTIAHAVEARQVFELEHRVRRADGSEGWTMSRAIPVLDEHGAIIEWFGMAADVSVLKKARDQQRLLNSELSHRMKNIFAMVQAITSQTLRSVGERHQIETLRQRLRALSTAHDILLGKSWTAASVREIAIGACEALGASDRIDQAGPEVAIGPRAALNMSLLLHELGTNAVKHGALSAPYGRVDLQWRVEGAGEKARFHMRWVESGGPAVAEPEKRGFGSRLISMGLLGTGGVDLRFDPSGLIVDISAPLSELQKVD